MKMSNSIRKADTIDYYSIVAGIRPGRSPSIYHREHPYYWTDFPNPPVFKIYNTTFHKVMPLAHSVDCRDLGQLHYWARSGRVSCPSLVVISFSPPNEIKKIRYFFYEGLEISNADGPFVRVTAPDMELFSYCLAGFLQEHLSNNYTFRFGRC